MAFRRVLVSFLLAAAFPVFGQSSPSAIGGGMSLEGGVGYSIAQPDYTSVRQYGPKAWADLNIGPRLKAEAQAGWLYWHGSGGSGIDNFSYYMAGPGYRLLRYKRVRVGAELLAGMGRMTYAVDHQSQNYFAWGFGPDADFRITRKLFVRGDYLYQIWPNAPGTPYAAPGQSHGLRPNAISVGVTYRLWH